MQCLAGSINILYPSM